MSVFSKLFSGSPKGDAEATSSKTGEEGPSMQPPPNDGRAGGAVAAQEAAATEKAAPPPGKPVQPRGAAGQASSPKGMGASTLAHAISKSPAATGSAPDASSPPSPVVVTRTIHVGGNTQAPTRSRPAMPVISIGPPNALTPPAAKQVSAGDAVPPAEKRSSVRPTAPEMMIASPRKGQASIADTFERLLSSEDLEASFASMQLPATANSPRSGALSDLAEVRSLFAQLATNHVRQVRDFMIELRWSESTTDWVPICQPALQSLRRAADKLELRDLCDALDRFAATLADVLATRTKAIAGASRETLLSRYDELSRLMPQAFALDLDRTQREAAILQSLLMQVPEVKKVTLDRMYAAGLTTLEAMFLANAGDIAATTGIPEPLAKLIVDRFRAYREQVKATAPDATRTRERELIAELTSRLRRENEEYEHAAASWSRDATDRKKGLRKVREQTLLDIQVALARLGEVDRLGQLERLPFEKKLAHLESFLEEAREKYVAQF